MFYFFLSWRTNMTDTAYSPDHDEPIYFTPNRQRIIVAGKCARAEQVRLERVLGLQDGRTPKARPGGYFD